MNEEMMFQYSVIRSRRRKTAAIRISEKGIEVRVPHWVDDKWVDDWVAQRAQWVQENSLRLKTNLDKFCLKVSRGALFPLRGEEYPIDWRLGVKNQVLMSEGKINIVLSSRSKKTEQERVRTCLHQWYKSHAHAHLSARLAYWEKQMGLVSNSLKIRDYKRRWGSCNAKGDIAFNWRLIHADDEIIDYVVIHELAHLVHLNHSKAFWQLVESYCKNWRVLRDELQKRNGWVLW